MIETFIEPTYGLKTKVFRSKYINHLVQNAVEQKEAHGGKELEEFMLLGMSSSTATMAMEGGS